jgi:hypothetical protein
VKLRYNIIVGQRFLKPKIEWEKVDDFWQAKIPGASYSYLVKRELPETRDNCTVWKLYVNTLKAGKKINKKGESEVAMVYSRAMAMAIAELLEAKDAEFKSFIKGRPGRVCVGQERRYINDKEWEIKGKNHAHTSKISEIYQLLRPDGCSKNHAWNLNIGYPGGPDSQEWELKNIDSLIIGQAIVALMTEY